MHTDNFEKAFEIFIDGKEYDATQQSIFELVIPVLVKKV